MATTAPKDTPLGHLVASAYDYVVSESLGFHIDFDKTLGIQYEALRQQKRKIEILEQHRFDSVIDKCDKAIIDMHRPIVKSETAATAKIVSSIDGIRRPLRHPLSERTFDYMVQTDTSAQRENFTGAVSSYNINTYKGRIFVGDFGRPIPFELQAHARKPDNVSKIVHSLLTNATRRDKAAAQIVFSAYRNSSKSGQLKNFLIDEIVDIFS